MISATKLLVSLLHERFQLNSLFSIAVVSYFLEFGDVPVLPLSQLVFNCLADSADREDHFPKLLCWFHCTPKA